jgi:hypothetical protein
MSRGGPRPIPVPRPRALAFCLLLGVACLAPVAGRAAEARASGSAPAVPPSQRFHLSRAVPGGQFVLLSEGRLKQTYWATYLFPATFEGHPKVCLMTASVLQESHFQDSYRCGQPWPNGTTEVPVRAFVRRTGLIFEGGGPPQASPELFGGFVLAPQVRSVVVHLAGGLSFRRPTRAVPAAGLRRLGLPEMRFATLSVASTRQIRSLTAYGADGAELATGVWPKG